MNQLSLEIPAGGEGASSQKQANDVPRRPTHKREGAGAQLSLLFDSGSADVVARGPDDAPRVRLPVLDERPLTIEECEERKTWLPYCPHVGCQYNLLVDVVNEEGALHLAYITPDGEIDLESVPRIIEKVDPNDVFEPEDMPTLPNGQTRVSLAVPATGARRVAQIVYAASNKGDDVEYLTLGKFMGLSKERVRQIANEAYLKGKTALFGSDESMSPSELFGEH